MWDTLFEFLRFICVAGIVSALWWAGRRYNLHLQKGWTLIFWGAVLVMGGSFLNLIDNVWGAAETVIGEFFEEVVGYVLGDLLIVIGFWRWLPVVGSLRKAERELEEANENLKVQVSERTFSLRDANTKLSQNMKQQALISHLGQMAISGENNLQELMDSAVRGVSEVLEVEYCKLLELLPDGKRLLLRAGVGWNPGLVGKATVGAGLDSQAGYTLMVSDPVIVKDLTRETRFSGPQLLHDHDVRSGISIAIGKKFHSYGVLGAHSKALRIFTKEQAEFIKSVALILTDAIHMDYLLNSLADNEERFRHLLETTSMIPWEADWERKQFSYVGKSASNILGYSIDAWQEEGFWADHIFSADRDHTVGLSRRLSENLEEFDIEYRMVSKSGEVVWIQDLVTVVQQQGSPAVLRGFMLNITDRKRAEEILKKSETRLRGIFDAAPDGVLMVRQDGRIAKSNGQIEVLFGYSPEDLVGQPLENLIPERFRKDHLQHIRSYFASPRTRPMGINMDLQALHKDGHEFPVEIGLSPFITDDEVFSIAGIRDIGWRKKAEADLEEKTQLLMQITDNIREILWIGSPDWETVVYVSPAYEEIWGRSSKSLYADGRSWMDGVHEEDREKVEGAVLRRVKGDFSETAFPEFRVVHPNGIIRWVTVRAYPVYDDQGKVFRVTGVAEDITNEVEARNRFKREHSETVRLKTLLEGVMQNMTTGLMVTDSSGGILLLNRIGGEILGISPGDVEGSPLVGVSPELENFEKSSSQKGAIREFVFKRSDGKAVPIGFSSSPLIREGSDPGGNITVFKDLTDQLDSEKKNERERKIRNNRGSCGRDRP